jgi:hypothetical protein
MRNLYITQMLKKQIPLFKKVKSSYHIHGGLAFGSIVTQFIRIPTLTQFVLDIFQHYLLILRMSAR